MLVSSLWSASAAALQRLCVGHDKVHTGTKLPPTQPRFVRASHTRVARGRASSPGDRGAVAAANGVDRRELVTGQEPRAKRREETVRVLAPGCARGALLVGSSRPQEKLEKKV